MSSTPDAPPRRAAPLAAGPPAGVRIELLNWDAIAAVVHPVRQHRPYLPSRFPYLPLTPQELLRAYLEIVGVAPHDSYGAQVTYDQPLDLLGRTSTSSHVRKTTGGDELPCADGKPRVRMHGGAHVVLAYRDSPAYAEGRRRWAAYEAEVLQADLSHDTDAAPPAARRQVRDGQGSSAPSTASPTRRRSSIPTSRTIPGRPRRATAGRPRAHDDLRARPRRVARRLVLGAPARAARAPRPRRGRLRPPGRGPRGRARRLRRRRRPRSSRRSRTT